MKNLKVLTLALLVSSSLYGQDFTPEEVCRATGVWVDDGSVKTGHVTTLYSARWNEDYRTRCEGAEYCPRYIGYYNGVYQWEAVYRSPCQLAHVVCHIEYQTYAHTEEYNNGDFKLHDWLNSCNGRRKAR